MSKVLIYRHESSGGAWRQADAWGVDCATADEWDDFAKSLRTEDGIAMVILDSVPADRTPDLARRIKKIKDIPVIFLGMPAESAGDESGGGDERGEPTDASAQSTAAASEKITYSNDEDPLERARRFMDDNFRRQLALKDIADMADISPSYFCRKFKVRFGLSPITYLRNLRIDRASHLLEHTNLPLANITEQSGFFSIPYFCREFRKVKGISPIQHRRQTSRSRVEPKLRGPEKSPEA